MLRVVRHIILISLFMLLVFVQVHLIAQDSCSDSLSSIISVGIRGRVAYATNITSTIIQLRSLPTINDGTIVMEMSEGYEFDVIGGSECHDGYRWWQVRTEDSSYGWVAEGEWSNIEPVTTLPIEDASTLGAFTDIPISDVPYRITYIDSQGKLVEYNFATRQTREISDLSYVTPYTDTCPSHDNQYIALLNEIEAISKRYRLDIIEIETRQVIHRIPEVRSASWHPSENILTYTMPVTFNDSYDIINSDGLWNFDVQTRTEELLLPSQTGFPLAFPRWSLDGDSMLFTDIRNIEGTGPDMTLSIGNTNLIDWGQDSTMGPGRRSISWFPDDSQIAIAEMGRIHIGDTHTGERQWLLGDRAFFADAPRVSPNERFLAFVTYDVPLNLNFTVSPQSTVFIYDFDNARIHRLLPDFQLVAWSPDSQYLLVRDSQNMLWVISLDGESRVQLGEGRCTSWTAPTLTEAMEIIGANNLELMGATGQGQIVVVIDTGVEASHEFFNGRVILESCYSRNGAQRNPFHLDWGLVDYVSLCPDGSNEQIGIMGSASPARCASLARCEHGTFVAGIAAGNNATRNFYGVARDAQIIAIQTSNLIENDAMCRELGFNSPCIVSQPNNTIQALEWILGLQNGGRIAAVNISNAGSDTLINNFCNESIYADVINRLHAAGIAVVVSAGNRPIASPRDFIAGIESPACVEHAISVGATTLEDRVAEWFSKSSPILDLLAPGVGIYSSELQNTYGSQDGTSFSAPFVTGAIAAIRSRLPNATVDEILGALICTGRPIEDSRNLVITSRIRVDIALGYLLGEYIVRAGDDEAYTYAQWAVTSCQNSTTTITIID